MQYQLAILFFCLIGCYFLKKLITLSQSFKVSEYLWGYGDGVLIITTILSCCDITSVNFILKAAWLKLLLSSNKV